MKAAGAIAAASFTGWPRMAVAGISGARKIPYPPKPWRDAIRLVGERSRRSPADIRGNAPGIERLPLYNDCCLTKTRDNRWHCIGILLEATGAGDFRQDRLFHYVSDRLEGPYHSVGYLDLGYGTKAGVWAPFILQLKDRALMFYAALAEGQLNIRVAESIDAGLVSWRRGFSGREILVSDANARDPQIVCGCGEHPYLMYYVCTAGYGSDDENAVRVRSSKDLISWSAPKTVLGTPPGYGAAESVFVLHRHHQYYLWVSSATDYSRMSLYISSDPFDFGNAATNRIEEQSGHACEIVEEHGRYWMACVAIASVPALGGKEPGLLPLQQHDLEGVYLQPLAWRPTGGRR